MATEIVFGLLTNSMALLADGIHMGSHVLAIGMSWLAYIFVRRGIRKGTLSDQGQRLLSLSGYTSGLILLVFAGGIAFGAIQRLNEPEVIQIREAILATIGLFINILSAILLHPDHDDEKDHNLKAAYLHVVADALTSILAIGGLLAAMWFNILWIDGACALAGAVIISRWSVKLIIQSGKMLIR